MQGASSDAGNYTVPQLLIGDYNLTVSVPGFKTYEHQKFHLSAGQTLREDIALQVGQTTESVTVSAESSLLQTESSQLAHNVSLSQLDNLPLLSVGATNDGLRDYFASSKLLPGIQYCDSGAACSAVVTAVINGTPSNTLQTRLDGATMNPTSSRLQGATMEMQPSTESIQEVAIPTSNFAPEFGTAGGAVLNMVTKSGTNSLHGSGYDYLVNEALNAAQPYTGIKNKLRQNDYGFTLGGPVWIPKLYNGKNKTFFFFSFEQFRQKLINDTLPDTVPIAAYHNGDFSSLITTENRLLTTSAGVYTDALGRTIQSGTIFDPTSFQTINGVVVRNPFPNNAIPVNRFDPAAMKILALIPQRLGPNASPVGEKLHMAFYFQRTNKSTPRTATAADDCQWSSASRFRFCMSNGRDRRTGGEERNRGTQRQKRWPARTHARSQARLRVFTQTAWDEERYALRDPDSSTYTGAIETAEEFGKRLYLEAWNRGRSHAVKKVVIGDGAEWIWNWPTCIFRARLRSSTCITLGSISGSWCAS